ncbi:3-oxo-tetronate kinase [Paraglaciecola sp. L3A3]|uniref:3-oxo-tetronate kinase n=1 Tax=Paraglaciecola sp. L3A3 TaxID=2686358 RepID=UPI00131B63B9|nr:3-oxo-tetronate kinase [Paraglaciecola sp. L3A3]
MINKLVLNPWLGCIADDYTGATDLASFLVASGLKTIQLNGLPDSSLNIDLSPYDAVVIALKSRTCAVNLAVNDSVKCAEYLVQQGCEKFFFKYCSTFDSTAEGNIGPVIDALMDTLQVSSTVVCPALPVNGRTVYNGYLFVNGQLLSESPMKDHPLTPMTESQLKRLLESQGQGQAQVVNVDIVEQGETELTKALETAANKAEYIIVDALNTQHLTTIAHSVSQFKLITGGSGLAIDLAAEYMAKGGKLAQQQDAGPLSDKPVVIFSGSCSAMTQKQVATYKQQHPSLQLNPIDIYTGQQSIETVSQWMLDNLPASPIIYASADALSVQKVHAELGREAAAEMVEQFFCQLAIIAKQQNVKNIIVAGGETSGAVVKALDITVFEIGSSIVPSVPIVQTVEDNPIHLVLKSGNFGQTDFFQKAKGKLTCS